MSFSARPTAPPSGSGGRRRPSPLFLTIVAVLVLVGLFVVFAQIYTEVLWFSQLDRLSVFTTEWLVKGALFAAGFVLMALPLWYMLSAAHRTRPETVPTTPREENLNRYREAVEPLRRTFTFAIPAVVGLLGGLALSASWQSALLFVNSVPFGREDAQYQHDLSFYVFQLPMVSVLAGYLGMVALLCAIAGIVAHYLFGGVRPLETRGFEISRAARRQLATALAVLVLIQAVRLFLWRYTKLTDDTGLVTGATYADVHAALPAILIVAVAAAIVAALVFSTAYFRTFRLTAISLGMLVVLGGVAVLGFPAAVQQFQVNPSQQSLEADYINRHLEATRDAYGIDDVEVIPYTPNTDGEAGALRQDAVTAASVRLLDPSLVSDTFRQLQQSRSYYAFPEQLDVDRYEIDGEVEDTVIALRELNPDALADSTWVNQATVYTHGIGAVAAYGSRQGGDGEPVFFEDNIPASGLLTEQSDYEPRVYFGERSTQYSIVGAPEGADPIELDYPADEDEGSGQVNYTFTGDAGPRVGDLFHRLLYAIKFQDEQIVLADTVNEESQILYDRTPRERVQKLAPFLEVDGDPYPAVIDGRIKWILDGYTTSNQYPYSRPSVLQEATSDANTQATNAVATLPDQQVNYIRNSVKITVDAYDGAVDFYEWDAEDPVLQAWMKVFPDLVQPSSEMSSELMSHVRYPEDLFKVQRSLLTQYHVSNASEYYSGQDFWTLPVDPTRDQESGAVQPPYFLTLQMPEQEEPAFSLTSSFIPRPTEGQTRNNLTGFLAATADAGSTPGEISEEYGRLRLLQLPRNTTFPGPGQAQNNFNTEPEIQTSLNLLRQGESQVENGNLLTLPVAGGLLYIQPVYVRSAGETSYPVLQRVLVAFGEQIGFAPTLDEALDQVFGGDSGAAAGDSDAADGSESGESGGAGGTGGDSGGGDEAPGLQDALDRAQDAMTEADEALSNGDFAAYGEAQERLRQALEDALEAEGVDPAEAADPAEEGAGAEAPPAEG
ncbi:UPF0182 family protein [Brevibacterium album]|uniref:UPF0182 family membrane protein n=1 Tax=Brevibacterium album TaxID=417948 RepID=UPI000429C3D3|nr:UPF0182 family protein [Brevibacterium album]